MVAVGIAERAERILIIVIATFLGFIWAGIVIVAILSLLTIIQRIAHVYQKT
jgi:archaetidylinositol phosphate synthase